MVQTGVNETGKAGHHERNKVAGEGAVSASGSETTSAGGEEKLREPASSPGSLREPPSPRWGEEDAAPFPPELACVEPGSLFSPPEP